MRIWALVTACLVLAGCATPAMDIRAIPQAVANRNLAYSQCAIEVAGKIGTAQEQLGCHLAATRKYAVELKLKQMGLVDAYEQKMKLDAETFDNGLISFDELTARFEAAYKTLADSLVAVMYQEFEDAAEREESRRRAGLAIAAGFLGAGQSFSNSAQSYRPPVNCTTQVITRFNIETTCR